MAFISKQHYHSNKKESKNSDIVDHEDIAMQLRGGDDEEEFERDLFDDEDDLRILDSLPSMVKPKDLQVSVNSKK